MKTERFGEGVQEGQCRRLLGGKAFLEKLLMSWTDRKTTV